jgi:hypothetical protein
MVKTFPNKLLQVKPYPNNFLVYILYLNSRGNYLLAQSNLYFNKNQNFYFFEIIDCLIY